ncbi:MAG: hypothetical protein HY902_06530 [Deltaproteobacteria bacterium]|nr:hypothetical protein [Deltaproteobacteria bacterium]
MTYRLLWIFVALVVTACSGAQVKLPANGPQSAADLLAALPASTVTSAQGQARLDAYVQGDRRSVTLLVVANRPDQVQFQALAPTLDLLGLLSSDGRHFVSFERGAATCQVGLACPANMQRFLPIPMPAADMVAALLGDLRPLAAPPEQQRLGWDGERHLYRLELGPTTGWRQELFVDPGTRQAVGAVWYAGSRRVASVQYGGERSPGTLPASVRVKVAAPDSDITIEYRDMQVNQPVNPEIFAVQCPPGTREVLLPCDATPSGETK